MKTLRIRTYLNYALAQYRKARADLAMANRGEGSRSEALSRLNRWRAAVFKTMIALRIRLDNRKVHHA